MDSSERRNPDLSRRTGGNDAGIRIALGACAAVAGLAALSVGFVLLLEAVPFFFLEGFSVIDLFGGRTWSPGGQEYSILPMVSATVQTAAIGALISLPLGLATAIYLAELAGPRTSAAIRGLLQTLSSLPTVVYGFFALTVVTPVLQSIIGPQYVGTYNLLSAGLVSGIYLTPLTASLVDDAVRRVPVRLRMGALGLGATRLEAVGQIVLLAARPGIFAAFVMSMARGSGQTMISAIASGSGPNLSLNPLDAGETLTSSVIRMAGGNLHPGGAEYHAAFFLGLLVFLLVVGLSAIARMLKHKMESRA